MKLSDTQRIILSQASQRDDRLAIPPERLPAAARQTVAKTLLKQGLVSDEHANVYNARDAWQIDGRTRLLRIPRTARGLCRGGHDARHADGLHLTVNPDHARQEQVWEAIRNSWQKEPWQTGKGQPRRLTFTDRAATWANGFPTRSPAQLPAMVDAGAPVRAEPVTHVMPMWEPAAVAAEVTLPACDEAPAALASSAAEASYPRARQSARRVADPFDASDDGANCMRCGYAIEPAREKCGFMTCAACR